MVQELPVGQRWSNQTYWRQLIFTSGLYFCSLSQLVGRGGHPRVADKTSTSVFDRQGDGEVEGQGWVQI